MAFETAAINALIVKSKRALKQTAYKKFVVAGGVAANRRLRNRLKELAKDAVQVVYPKPALCMDNGVMVAYAGMVRFLAGQKTDLSPQVKARWRLSDLCHPIKPSPIVK